MSVAPLVIMVIGIMLGIVFVVSEVSEPDVDYGMCKKICHPYTVYRINTGECVCNAAHQVRKFEREVK